MSRIQKAHRGLSLLEVVLASSMMLMIMVAVYAVAATLQRSQIVTEARVEARQAVRTGLNRFSTAASGAVHFFSGPSDGSSLTINGYTCHLPYLDSGDRFDGDSVAVAVPEDLTRPQNPGEDPESPSTVLSPLGSSNAIPDGFPDHTFTVVLLTSRPRTAPSRSVGARDLVLLRWDQVKPPTPRQPASIDLEALGAPTNMSVFDAFLRPLDQEGIVTRYLQQEGQPVSTCIIKTNFRHLPRQGAPQEEFYEFALTTRNR